MAKMSSGSYDLNRWLYGGYDSDVVSVVYGGPGTGKTTFCLLTAVSQAKKGNKVIFIDSEGGFSIERIKQIAGNEEDNEKALENIILLKVTNFDEQRNVFRRISSYLKDEVSLIVVDGMTILYRLDFAIAREKDEYKGKSEDKDKLAKTINLNNEEMKKINLSLIEQMKTLNEIARKKSIPVLVTNQVYSWQDEKRMVGGDILNYWGKCLIELVNERGRRTAYLRKHRSLPEKKMDFSIVNEGIRKKGWI